MHFAELLKNVPVIKLHRATFGKAPEVFDLEISHIRYNSRSVEPGDLFVALPGSTNDGHKYIGDAVDRGAICVVVEQDESIPDQYLAHRKVTKVLVSSTRRALARMAANFYGNASKALTTVGVTGTNGKTTTSTIIKAILDQAGMNAGLIGTIEYRIGNEIQPASHTTPESLELQQLLAQMVAHGCKAVSMEVSSHALDQYRVYSIDFNAAVFTNLTQDHLDYHGSMGEYLAAKKKLFVGLSPSAAAVVNNDDLYSKKIVDGCPARVLTFGTSEGSDVRGVNIKTTLDGTEFTIQYDGKGYPIVSSLVGVFNVSNLLAAFATGVSLNLPVSTIIAGMQAIKNVRGRFERIFSTNEGWTAIIDYAHTPDALQKCLRAINDVLPEDNRGKIITVFGAGGDRDKTKRPLMGTTVAQLSDILIVTSDNPRTELPEQIIDDIVAGIPQSVACTRIVDRKQAIEFALQKAKKGDVVLIAGKGHEDYQVIGTMKKHFSDREVVEACMQKR